MRKANRLKVIILSQQRYISPYYFYLNNYQFFYLIKKTLFNYNIKTDKISLNSVNVLIYTEMPMSEIIICVHIYLHFIFIVVLK